MFKKIKNSKRFGKYGKHAFILWLVYQTIKGALTTSLIWIPLAYYYFSK